MVKLAAAIKHMEADVGISDIISAGMRFAEWMRRADLEKAKELVRLWDVFQQEQMR